MNEFTRIISNNYDFPNHTNDNTNGNLSKKSKLIMLSSDNYNSYMNLFRKVTRKKKMYLPKIQLFSNVFDVSLLPSSHVTTLSAEFASSSPRKLRDTEEEKENTKNYESPKEEKSKLLIAKEENEELENSNKEKEEIEKYLKEHLSLGENFIETKEKAFQTERSNSKCVFVELKFKSISIEVKEKDVENKKNKSKVFIFPFEFLPFFYSLKLEDFLLFITEIIKPIDNVEIFAIDMEIVKSKVDEYKEKCPLFSNEANLYNICDKKDYELQYDWISQDKIFEVKINLPIFECTISNTQKKNKLRFKQIPSNNIICKLLFTSFDKWDEVAFSTFYSYTQFRKLFHSINNTNFISQEKFFMLNHVVKKEKSFSSFIEYLISFTDKSFYVKLYSYQFNITYPFVNRKKKLEKENENEKEEEEPMYIYKNFELLSKLYEVPRLHSFMNRFNLNDFIEMCLRINRINETVEINQEIYNSIEEEIFPIGSEDKEGKIKMKKNDIVDTLTPRLEWKIFKSEDYIEQESEEKFQVRSFCLPNEVIDKLSNDTIENWSKILKEYIKEFEMDFMENPNEDNENYSVDSKEIQGKKKE